MIWFVITQADYSIMNSKHFFKKLFTSYMTCLIVSLMKVPTMITILSGKEFVLASSCWLIRIIEL